MQTKKCFYCGSTDLKPVTVRSDGNTMLQCAECQLLMVQDLPKDLEVFYGAEYFGKDQDTKVGYTEYYDMPTANFLGKYALARLFVDPPGRHLDLGAADGSLMETFRANGFETHGLEISKDAAEVARAKGLKVTVSHLDPLPSDLGPINVCTAFDLLEHVTNPGEILKQVHKHLAPGGFFVFSTLDVKQLDSSEFWFNTSLEHTTYFTAPSLDRILTDVFGKSSFAYREVVINGISEFWGVAKKGQLGQETGAIENLLTVDVAASDTEKAFLISLLLNQLGRFKDNRELIKRFNDKWSPRQQIEANFYLNYFQGKFEVAIRGAAKKLHLVAADNGVFWQAFNHAQRVALQSRLDSAVQESNDQIIGLREEVFQLKGRIHRMRSYFVIGFLIRAREKLGRTYKAGINFRVRMAKGLKWRVGKALPAFIRVPLKKLLYFDYKSKLTTTRKIATRKWHAGIPLVSVVVPYYNMADTIDDTLNSLRAQTFTNFEVIIVNDGSNDPASVEKIHALRLVGLNAQIYHQENQGTFATRNAGVKKAKGKYVICLDSDDLLAPTYIEKCTVTLEADPAVALVTTDRDDFGVQDTKTRYVEYDPQELYVNNMVTTAAQFRKEAWNVSGGYKGKIGYEDWEFWINLAENGFWGKHIAEILFHYRVSMKSRFVGDKDIHWSNLRDIRDLHPKYKARVSSLISKRQFTKIVGDPATALINLGNQSQYKQVDNRKPNVLITIPWMNFGGAETLIYNYTRQLKDEVNLSFITGLQSDHEWDYKFQEVTPRVFHMANLFNDPAMHYEFIANYIETRNIDILHIVHNGFTFDMLPQLRERFPRLKIAVTLFNDRVSYFVQSMEVRQYIDRFTSDNSAVANHYTLELGADTKVRLIPNGINCFDEFSPALFDRQALRTELGLEPTDIAVFFGGRLSEEKNPNVFIDAAKKLLAGKKSGDLRFFILGDGPMRPKIELQLKEVASSKIKLLGYHSDVARYLAAADIFVLPSSIEGFPLSILEAMGMRLPVIASRVGAIPDVVEEGVDGYIVTPGSADEIAQAITKLDKDHALLNEMKEKARLKVERKYSTTALGQNYLNLYRELS